MPASSYEVPADGTGAFKSIRPTSVKICDHPPSLAVHMVKSPPAMWETWVLSLGREDPLEEGMAIHSSILAWRIPMDRGAWWAIDHGIAKSQMRLSD